VIDRLSYPERMEIFTIHNELAAYRAKKKR
jgi:hypothetical protein